MKNAPLLIKFYLVSVALIATSVRAFATQPVPTGVDGVKGLCERQLLSDSLLQVKSLGAQITVGRFIEARRHFDSTDRGLHLALTYQSNSISESDRERAEKLGQRMGVAYFDELVPVQTLKFPESGFSPKMIDKFISAVAGAVADPLKGKKVLILEFPSYWEPVSELILLLVLENWQILGINNDSHLVILHVSGPSIRDLPVSSRDSLYLVSGDSLSILGTDQFELEISEMLDEDIAGSEHVIVPPQ